ncbi:MBL fold metallo-hydrolase [Eionea flava]
MLIRQFYDQDTFSFSYLIADMQTQEALLIDPVKDCLAIYLQQLKELNLTLIYALDTHLHADHVTGMGDLRQHTQCQTLVSEQSNVACADGRFSDDTRIYCGNIILHALYTPGHTNDSYSFYIEAGQYGDVYYPPYVFTGDTLFIRGTGRTDFMGGSSEALYHSLFARLLTLPEQTIVFPGHDYKGMNQSTIGEEKKHNPRLQVKDWQALDDILSQLNLANPKKFTEAINANMQCGEVSDG